MSVRRACSALRIDRSLYVYKSKRGDQAALKHRIKDICEARVRYGYRRVHVLLQRDGWTSNIKRVYRLDRELGLQLRNKTPKRRVKAKLREGPIDAQQVNETWAMDFVHDQLATGRKIRVLTIVDTFSRFSPAVDPRFSYRGEDVVLTLERICKTVGYPKTIRVDQGSEFISRDLDIWAYDPHGAAKSMCDQVTVFDPPPHRARAYIDTRSHLGNAENCNAACIQGTDASSGNTDFAGYAILLLVG